MASYETFGRRNQKRRTRDALKEAAAEIVRGGELPAVTEVAKRARVSRATAYRYFPSQDALVAEVLLDETIRPALEAVYQVASMEGTAEKRLDEVVKADHRLVVENQTAFRSAIRAMMLPGDAQVPNAGSVPHRPGNRLRYLADAVRPVADRLGPERAERLVMALAMCVGLESILVMQDICGLNAAEAEATKRWAAAKLLRGALEEVDDERVPNKREP